MSAIDAGMAGESGESRESRVRSLFGHLRESLSRAASTPLELSHTEQAIQLAQSLRAELIAGGR